jgi:hypothetical protein
MAEQTFTAGQVLTAAQMTTLQTNIGLNFITTTTIGSGVSTVTVAGCFTTTYDNYQIVISGADSSSLNNLVTLQLNNSTGTTYTSSSFYIIHNGATGSATGTNVNFRVGWGGDVSDTSSNITLYSPFLAKRTGMTAQASNNSLTSFNGGVDTSAVSSTGFTLSVGADTLTGGTVTVYGYRKA